MKKIAIELFLAALVSGASAQPISFGSDAIGAQPQGWRCGVTGSGIPHWVVASEPGTMGDRKVLLQDGRGSFPWCVKKDRVLTDGFVETRLKPISGHEDQAGGVVWRWKDGDHYYVARANALENNVSLYYVEGGSRKALKYADAPVAKASWHTLRVDFSGTHMAVSLDGKRYIEVDDKHIAGPGAVGVWTKSDSVTAFDQFSSGPAHP